MKKNRFQSKPWRINLCQGMMIGLLAVSLGLALPIEAHTTRDDLFSRATVQVRTEDRGSQHVQFLHWGKRSIVARYLPQSGSLVLQGIELNGSIGKTLFSVTENTMPGAEEAIIWIHDDHRLRLALRHPKSDVLRLYELKVTPKAPMPYGFKHLETLYERHFKTARGMAPISTPSGKALLVAYPHSGLFDVWPVNDQKPFPNAPYTLKLPKPKFTQWQVIQTPQGQSLAVATDSHGELALYPLDNSIKAGEAAMNGEEIPLEASFTQPNLWNKHQAHLVPLQATSTSGFSHHLMIYFPDWGLATVAALVDTPKGPLYGEPTGFVTGNWTLSAEDVQGYTVGEATFLWARDAETGKEQILTVATDEPITTAGPMIGGVSNHEARFWIYRHPRLADPKHTQEESAPLLTVIPIHTHPGPKTVEFTPSNTLPGVWMAAVDGLTSSTDYSYSISQWDDHSPAKGQFKTAPSPDDTAWKEPIPFVVSSCMNVNVYPRQLAWKAVQAFNPQFQIIIGDSAYVDSTLADNFLKQHLRQRVVPEYAEALLNLPTTAVWDDHDFATNNSDRRQDQPPLHRVFQDLFPNPHFDANHEGQYFKMPWGPLDFFVLDVRTHRDPNFGELGEDTRNNPDKTMLGPSQFHWLTHQLKASQAPFKLILSGSTLNANPGDSWRLYQAERAKIFDFIKVHRIPGVLWVTGDIHQSRIEYGPPKDDPTFDQSAYPPAPMDRDAMGYPLVEVITSGIANNPTFAFASFVWEPDPTGINPGGQLRIQIREGDGRIREEQVITPDILRSK